jgi:hypothetical protein
MRARGVSRARLAIREFGDMLVNRAGQLGGGECLRADRGHRRQASDAADHAAQVAEVAIATDPSAAIVHSKTTPAGRDPEGAAQGP